MKFYKFLIIFALCFILVDLSHAKGAQMTGDKAVAQLKLKDIAFTGEGFFKEVRSGKIENVKIFIDAGIDVNTKDELGLSALYVASGLGHVDIVKLLLDANAVIDYRNPYDCSTALINAVAKKHKEVVRLLVE